MHVPVLLQEVMRVLRPAPGELFVDGTLGAGGHARAVMQQLIPKGSFLGVDRDPRAVDNFLHNQAVTDLSKQLARVIATSGTYADLPAVLVAQHLGLANGVLVDLGFSSDQIDSSEPGGRGFSFSRNEPLLMTYDPHTPPVREILRDISEEDLGRILNEYGEERYAREIARAIVKHREHEAVETTKQLVEIILSAVPANRGYSRIHPATRTFMALRIYANAELEHLKKFLDNLGQVVAVGGRVAVISFHSLEDRIVKQYFKSHSIKPKKKVAAVFTGEPQAETGQEPRFELITKKPIIATPLEIQQNPRSRSAKLRAAIRVA